MDSVGLEAEDLFRFFVGITRATWKVCLFTNSHATAMPVLEEGDELETRGEANEKTK